MKQVPFHPRDRLKRKIKVETSIKKSKNGDVAFVKQVPVHPRQSLKRIFKLENLNDLNKKKIKRNEITVVKQVPLHPRERLKRLSKLDDKVHFVKEVVSVKPKPLTKTKKKMTK